MSSYLLEVARRGDAEGLKSILISARGEANTQELNHALLKAAKNGHSECVKILLDAAADPDIEDCYNNSNTPLVLAAINDHVDVVKQLIDAGASVNKTNKYDQTALYYAVKFGPFDLVKVLLDAGCRTDIEPDEDLLPLPMAAARDNYALTELLLQYGAHVTPKDDNLQTALHYASTEGNIKIVKLLLDYGAQIDSTSMKCAFVHSHTNLARFLEEQCGDSDMVRYAMGWALSDATFIEYLGAMTRLLKAGTNPNFVDEGDLAPVLREVIDSNVDTVKLLIQYGCNVDVEGETYLGGETYSTPRRSTVSPIYAAVWNKHVELASMIYMASMKTQKQIKSTLSCNDLKKKIRRHEAIEVWLKDTFSNPPSLLHLCRQNIRACILPQHAWGTSPLSRTISKLSIPQLLKDYLMMEM